MPKHLRTLLVEDNRIEARQIQHWLTSSKEALFKVEWVTHLAPGHERLSQGDIDLVLLDLNLPDSSGMETFKNLRQAFPDVPIVVLTGESDGDLGLEAVQQGAQDYLIKHQIDGPDLTRALFYAAIRHRAYVGTTSSRSSASNGRVFGFLGAKGGVGNTTIAINVAAALAERGKSVILAELRPSFGTVAFNFHFGLNGMSARSLRSLAGFSPDPTGESDVDTLLSRGPSGIRILFGPQSGESLEELNPAEVERLLQTLKPMAEYIILDLPNQLTAATRAAVSECDFVGIVSERETDSLHSGTVTVHQLETWGIGGRTVGGIVVVRTILPVFIEASEVQAILGCRIACVIPEASAACAKARRDGVPLVISQPSNDAAIAIADLARALQGDRVVGISV